MVRVFNGDRVPVGDLVVSNIHPMLLEMDEPEVVFLYKLVAYLTQDLHDVSVVVADVGLVNCAGVHVILPAIPRIPGSPPEPLTCASIGHKLLVIVLDCHVVLVDDVIPQPDPSEKQGLVADSAFVEILDGVRPIGVKLIVNAICAVMVVVNMTSELFRVNV